MIGMIHYLHFATEKQGRLELNLTGGKGTRACHPRILILAVFI